MRGHPAWKIWRCVALVILASGCHQSSPEPELDLSSILGRDAAATLKYQEFDFGTVLAQGQTLRHEFTLENPTDRPIRLVNPTAFTPCCSAFGKLPGSIPPRGEARVPVVFKPGFQSGLKRVEFTVESDAGGQPAYRLGLQARLGSAWEVQRLDGSDTSLPLGKSGRQTFRLVARRKGNEGRELPESILASPPVKVTRQGTAQQITDSEGWTEATQEIQVALPPTVEIGRRRTEIALRWPGGQSEPMRIGWEVRPRLKVTPAAVVLPPSQGPNEQTIIVQSDGHPFRIKGVRSPTLAEQVQGSDRPETRHVLRLKLDLSKFASGTTSDVVIQTDHPDQPTTELSVLVLDGPRGGEIP